MTMMNMLSVMPIIILATLAMAGAACAFTFNDPSRSMLAAPRAPPGTRCAATIAGDSKWHPQSSSRANSLHLGHSRRLESLLFARRRRGSSADEEDEYDDEYIDDLINEKFDDDFDDDDFIIDAEVEESSIAGADKDDDREYEYARVGRRRGRGADRYEESGSRGDGDRDGPSSSSSRREQRRRRSYAGDDVDQYDGYDAEFDEEDDDYEEDYEEEYDSDDDVDDDDDDDDEDDFEEGILIPNPILDSVDPEGAAERIGELFEDPKFFRDMAVVAFVVWVVYFLTFDPTDLVPWDIMKPEDFPLESLYEKR